MILGRDTHLDKKIYHTSALVIDVLKEIETKRVEYFELHVKVCQKHGLSVNAVTLALDWLYLLGVINHTNGEVEKCF